MIPFWTWLLINLLGSILLSPIGSASGMSFYRWSFCRSRWVLFIRDVSQHRRGPSWAGVEYVRFYQIEKHRQGRSARQSKEESFVASGADPCAGRRYR